MNLNLKKALDLYAGGLLIILLRPFVILLGKVLRRNHAPSPQGDITIIKLLGGGSLVIGLPALLAIKKTYPERKLQLLTTNSIAPFAETLSVFDEVLRIDDTNLVSLIRSSFVIIKRLFRTDTIIDWEVYSRLTTIFALLTCARNRIGFYREDVKSRQYFSTHLVYFNLYYGSWFFYEKLSRLIGCNIPASEEVRDHFLHNLRPKKKADTSRVRVGIGHGCSDLSKERMLSASQWKKLAQMKLEPNTAYEFHFFGSPADADFAEQIIDELKETEFDLSFQNRCGKTKLIDSVRELASMDEFWGIDSALMHYARLSGVKTRALFGPTAPISLLKPLDYLAEEIMYKKVPCSPCVHVTEIPPCKGNNICIKSLFGSNSVDY